MVSKIGLRFGGNIAALFACLGLGCGSSVSGDEGADGSADDDAGDGATGGDGDGGPTTGADDDSGTSGGNAEIPCEIQDLLATRCQMCHADPPQFGAPMPLVEYGDVLRPANSDPARTVGEMMALRLVDPVTPMPPTGTLPAEELDLVTGWLADGAPVKTGVEACNPPDPPGPPGPMNLPCEPDQVFRAHSGDGSSPFHVPVTDDVYICFTFASPFAAGQQGVAWAPIVDDERVLHHWILYSTNSPQVDGGVGPCNMPGDAEFLAGWAPGGENFVMPDDVGLELAGPTEGLILQMHYNNSGGYNDALDNSGVAMCTTDTPRANTAGVIWLGDYSLNIPAGSTGHTETGVCPSSVTSFLPGPLNVLSSFPHMHELGRAFRTEIDRGGATEMLVDVPQFTFSNQIGYPYDPPVLINPGDALTTTCTYDNPGPSDVHFGEGTSDEMCFNFILVYPIAGLPARQCL